MYITIIDSRNSLLGPLHTAKAVATSRRRRLAVGTPQHMADALRTSSSPPSSSPMAQFGAAGEPHFFAQPNFLRHGPMTSWVRPAVASPPHTPLVTAGSTRRLCDDGAARNGAAIIN